MTKSFQNKHFKKKKKDFDTQRALLKHYEKFFETFSKKSFSNISYGVNNENYVSVEYSRNDYPWKYLKKGSETLAQEPSEDEFEYEYGEDDFFYSYFYSSFDSKRSFNQKSSFSKVHHT